MLSTIKTYLANQARKPSGWFGRIVAPRVFKRENSEMENFGLEFMDPDEDDRILEIGFGHGRFISEVIPRIKKGEVCGIDISDEMAEVAAGRNRKWIGNGKLEIKQASIADIPYPDNYFNRVFTCNTIYFWPNPAENIREVRRVLKPNGEFYCAFRNKELMESKSSVVTENRNVFQNLYRPREVRELYQQAGFREVVHHRKNHNSEDLHLVIGTK